MSKAKGFLLLAAATVFLLSCSEDLKPIERQTLEDLETLQSSSSSGEGTNFSSSSEVENLSSSNEAANLSSSGEAASSSSSGEVANPSSSSEAANPSSSSEEQKPAVSGVSQKGPFLNKTPVMLYELNSSLAQTGDTFLGMTDDKGNFKIEGIELASPYALLMANGYYRNEVRGENSAAPIMLYAIADMRDRSSVNVNILTHLEYDRVQALVKEEGKSFGKAKEQALGEILKVFGIDGSGFKGSEDMSIFGESESDAALLAISILLQSSLTEGSFLDLLAEFSQKLKETGTWDNKPKKEAIAVWADTANLTDIRRNIVGWGLAPSIPEFEKYITSYAAANSPTGDCEPYGNYFCYSGQFYEKCNGQEYNPDNRFCYKNQPYDKCDGHEYAPPGEECKGGVVGRLCNGLWYDPSENYCINGELKSCGNKPYNPATQFCYNYVTIYDKCGDNEYDPKTHSCYNDQTYSCGGKPYDPNTHSCYNNQTYTCGNKPYDPNTHSCHNRNIHPNKHPSRKQIHRPKVDSHQFGCLRCGSYRLWCLPAHSKGQTLQGL